MKYTCQRVSFEKAQWGFIQFHHYRLIVGCNTCHMYKRIQSLVSWFFIVDINIYKTKNRTVTGPKRINKRDIDCVVLDKNSEKLLQPPLLPVDYKQTLRPCLHSQENWEAMPLKENFFSDFNRKALSKALSSTCAEVLSVLDPLQME